jgi:hypothetical protein
VNICSVGADERTQMSRDLLDIFDCGIIVAAERCPIICLIKKWEIAVRAVMADCDDMFHDYGIEHGEMAFRAFYFHPRNISRLD